MPYATLRDKKTELIRKARDGSVFIASVTADAITSLTTGSPTSEVQTVTITGSPTGGTFRLTFAGAQTATIAWNAAAAAVEDALEALYNINPGDVVVGGGAGPGTPWTVTFQGQYANENVAEMTATHALTGGTSPAIAVTTTTAGVAVDLAALPSGYEDLGWTSTDGVTYGRETEVSDVNSFGSVEPTRSDVTRDTITMSVVAQETKLLTLGLYTGAETAAMFADATTGELQIAKPARPGFRYYRVLGLFVDDGDYGEVYIGRYMPRARITEFTEQQFTDGDDPISYGLTFTGFEDSTLGFSHQWLFGGPGWHALLAEMGISTA
jgi:hypothetical protein